MKQKATAVPMVARMYLRVSTDAQDLERQAGVITAAPQCDGAIYRQ
ncbi:hypothetical protein [Paenalcaligenes niemegkensis]